MEDKEIKKEWLNREIIELFNGLDQLAKLSIDDKQLKWVVATNLKRTRDIVRQFNDMVSEFKPENQNPQSKDYRDLTKVILPLTLLLLKKFDLEKVIGCTAEIESLLFNLIIE